MKKRVDHVVRSGRKVGEKVVDAATQPIKGVANDALGGLRQFAKIEASGGIVLACAAAIALLVFNSPLAPAVDQSLRTHLRVEYGTFGIDRSLLHWINDGLMAVFFFLAGLELKRELLGGQLREFAKLALPAGAALGGILVPSIIYIVLNSGSAGALRGWAIPAATDIAFALGVMSLLGSRIPSGLSTFLLSLAIFDDVGAILIIAVFYGGELQLWPLAVGAVVFLSLGVINLAGVRRLTPYVLLSVVLWAAFLKSGVHATVAGLLAALTVPFHGTYSPLRTLEGILHPWVAFFVLPVFAFANAGVSFANVTIDVFASPVTLGIVLGLIVGKQIGTFGFGLVLIRMGWARLPEHTNWTMFYGACVLTGIGFTMSLFIGGLAFEEFSRDLEVRTAVIAASLVSAGAGLALLAWATRAAGGGQDREPNSGRST